MPHPTRAARAALLAALSAIASACGGGGGGEDPGPSITGDLAIAGGPAVSLGTAVVGAPVVLAVTLQSTSNTEATGLSAQAPAAPFSFAGGAYPGTGGSCGATLAAGASCTMVLAFAPAEPGAASGTLALDYTLGTARTLSATLSASGLAPASLALSGAPTLDLGDAAAGGSASALVTLSNSGDVEATSLGASFTGAFAFTGASWPGTAGTCGPALAAGASCTLELAFLPAAPGAAAGQLSVSYDDGVAPASAVRALAGTGRAPALVAVSGASFPLTLAGETSAGSVTLTNSGEVAATSLSATASGPFSVTGGVWPGTGGTCGSSLAAGASCTVAVRFAPVGHGPAAGTLAVAYHDGAAATSADGELTGEGLVPAALTLSGASDLGAVLVGSSAEADVTVTNAAGGADASSLAVSFGGPFARVGGTCGTSLAAGASCTVRVAFSPAARGPATGSVTIAFDGGAGADAAARPLAGAGLLPAALVLAPDPLDLGGAAVGAAAAALQTVSNVGDVEATSLDGAVTGPFAFTGTGFPGALGTCGTSLAAGASCTVELQFVPGTTGGASGTIALAFESGVGPASAGADLAGEGLAPASLEIAGTADLGGVLVGERSTRVLTLTNTGEVSAALGVFSLDASFEWAAGTADASGDCDEASPLAPGEGCTIEVAFEPAASGDATGSLSVPFTDAVGTRSASLSLSGHGLSPAVLALSDEASYDFGTIAVGATATHVVHVTNSGEWPAALGTVSASAPFGFAGATYPGTGGSCGATLEPGHSCRVVLAFSPSAAGPAGGALSIPYDDGVQGRAASLALTGAATDLAFLAVTDFPPHYYSGYGLPPDGPVHDYGAVGVGRSASHVFHVTNTGAGEATLLVDGGLSGPFGWKGGAYPGLGGTCADALAAGATCQVVVEFAPAGAGAVSGTFTVGYHDGMSDQAVTRSLSGSGTDLASLVFYDFEPGLLFGETWDFGPIGVGVGVASEHDLWLVNAGAGAATDVTALAPPAGFGWKGGAFPGLGGTCGGALAAGAACRAVAVFQPQEGGQASGELRVSYDDGSGATQIAARAVRGTGVTTALVLVEPEDGVVVSFGVVGVGKARDRTLRIRNVGGAEATGISPRALAAPFSFAGTSWPGTGGTCGATLASGAECLAVVRFAPTAAGAAGAQVALDYQDGAGAAVATRDLAGTGTDQALLAISDHLEGFDRDEPRDAIELGTSAAPVTRTLYVRNLGAQDATAVAFSTAAPFAVGSNACGATIAAGATCTIDVTFTPEGDGPRAATFRVDYDAGDAPATASVALTGVATTRAMVLATTCRDCGDGWYPEDHDFGTWGTRVEQTVYLRNVGAQSATLSSAVVVGAPVFDWAFGGAFPGVDPTVGTWPGDAPFCGATLAAGSACRIAVAFSPPASSGVHGGLLSIAYSDAGGEAGALSFPLFGTSTVDPLVEIVDPNGGSWGGDEPPPIQFGSSGQDVTRQLLVVNRGGGEATLGNAELPSGFSWASGSWPGAQSPGGYPPPCGATLGAGEECFVSIRFAAGTLTGGTYTGAFTLAWGPGGHEASRQLTGTAVESALVAVADSPNQYAWPGQPPADFGTSGLPVTRTFYVTNSGRQPAMLTPAAFASVAFDWTPWAGGGFPGGDPALPPPEWSPWEGSFCGATLAAGATCRLSVTFTPPPGSSESYADAVGVAYEDAGGPRGTASRAVVGTAMDDPLLEIVDSPWDQAWPQRPPYDFGVLGQPAMHVFIVRNVGGATAAIRGGTLPLGFAFPDAAGGYEGTFPGQASLDPSYPPLCSDPLFEYLLEPGETCSVLVAFVPAAVVPPGTVQGPLLVAYDDGMGGAQISASRDLAGTATDRAIVSIVDSPTQTSSPGDVPPPLDFGAHAQPVYRFLYVRNDGAAAADLTAGPLGTAFTLLDPVASGLPAPMPWEPADCPAAIVSGGVAPLAPGEACRVAVSFTAPLPGGSYSTTLVVGWADGLGPDGEARRELAGTSIDGPLLTIRDDDGGGWLPPAYDYGLAGTEVEHWFYVRNDGRAAATLTSFGVGQGWDVDEEDEDVPPGNSPPAEPCRQGATLGVGERCALKVVFVPVPEGDPLPEPLPEGPASTTLEVRFETGVVTRALVGSVTYDAFVFVSEWTDMPPCEETWCMPADFWTTVGSTDSRVLWVTNRGGADALSLSDASALDLPFGWADGAFPGRYFPEDTDPDVCAEGGTLAPGARCRLLVSFAPTDPGEWLDEVRVDYVAGLSGAPASASRALRGTAAPPP